MTELATFSPRDVADIPLEHEDVPADQIAHGRPSTAATTLVAGSGVEVGVWEMTAGGMFDVEVDEFFVVVSGAASVTLLTDGEDATTIELRPGSVCRLAAGSHTRWDVTETLRKIYVAEGAASES